jgi:hypothetical protein
MIKVSMKEFYEKIGQLDVVLSVQGNYPYKTIFKTRYGKEVGISVGKINDEDDFFLYKQLENDQTTTDMRLANARPN